MKMPALPRWLTPKRVAVAASLAGATLALGTGATWGSGALFNAFNLSAPGRAQVGSIWRYWSKYGSDPVMRKKLVGSMALSYGTSFGLPLVAYAYMKHKRPLYGAARFATLGEMEAYGLFKGDGIIIGKVGGRYITYPGEEFVLVSAPTRSKKTQGVVLANAIEWPESMLVIDMKDLEIFEASAGWQAKQGKKVGVWSPYDEGGRTGQHNFLAYIRTDVAHVVGDLFELAYWWFPDPSEGRGSSSDFFQTQCRNLLVGLGLFLLETPETELPRTMGQMLRLASGGGEHGLREHIERLITQRHEAGRRLSASCERFLGRVLTCSESPETFVSIFSTFTGTLSMFDDPMVDAATSGCTFDVSRLMYEPMALYAHVPFGKLEQSRILLNAFLSQVVSLNSRRLPKNDTRRRFKVLGIFDELTVAGRINVYAEGIGFLAAYGWRFLSVCQTQTQLASKYGEKDAETIVDNHGCQIIFAPRRETTAEQYAKELGTVDERVRSHSRTVGGQGTSTGENTSIQRRNLLTPDEVRYLGEDHLIALFRGLRPVLADKALVYRDKLLSQRVITPPEIPALDLAMHIARIEMRWRALKPGEGESEADEIPVGQLHGVTLPPRPPSGEIAPEHVDNFIDAFFGGLADAQDSDAGVAACNENWVEESGEPPAPPLTPRDGDKGQGNGARAEAATAVTEEPPGLYAEVDLGVLDEPGPDGDADGITTSDAARSGSGLGTGGVRDSAEAANAGRGDTPPGQRSGAAGNAGRGRQDPAGHGGPADRGTRRGGRAAGR
jgi:type IV secretion system protein VirD4